MEEISILGKKWIPKNSNEKLVYQIINSYSLKEIEARLIASRNISLDEITNFLDPKLKNLIPDPFHLLDMDKAVKTTIAAIENKRKIIIFGDYDVDGATSSALLKRLFDIIGLDSDIYIPDRITEGYGPSIKAMDIFKKNKVDLVFTLDCGAMAFEPIKHAKEIGIDVIVIDHHIGSEDLPEAIAVVNPNRIDEESNLKNLAAVGVTFLFAIALTSRLKSLNFFTNKKEPNLIEFLDLVAVGTICDVMDLSGLNRAFVKQGIKILSQTKNLGLKTLIDIASIETKINTYHIGFIIGPRINAGGRVGKSYIGAKLLSINDENLALEYAYELEKFNNERKIIEQEILLNAEILAETQKNNNSIILYDSNWHQGVIGIIAGRIKDKFRKPTIIISFDENNIGKASCRSIKSINIGAKISNAKNLGILINGGGHAAAAGFTIHKNKLDDFTNYINSEIEKEKYKFEEENISYYDIAINNEGLNLELIESIQKLAPFGNGNNEPIIKVSDLFVVRASISSEKHISLILAPDKDTFGKKTINAICFNSVGTKIYDVLMSKNSYKITFYGNLRLNEWQNKQNIQLLIHDIKI